ncbi:MAG: hypothetical protein HY067_09720 [Betaproteobacteria bacterium]|nr:hypothetical protein [Betaproteobacteria bacterium]
MWKRIYEWALFIAAIVVVAVAMILISIPRAQADGVDAIRAQGQIAYCANWTTIAMFGLDNRSLWNSERRIEGVTELEPGKAYPGIIIFEWDALTVQEKELIDNAVFFGYDAADKFLRNGGAFTRSLDERRMWFNIFMSECLSRRQAVLEAPPLRLAASRWVRILPAEPRLSVGVSKIAEYAFRVPAFVFNPAALSRMREGARCYPEVACASCRTTLRTRSAR